ncbi:MAG: GTPase ObgE [Spirochaetaceae bacterium]|jgi:GTP-binding protein|nr:GTPase ObgE [Spirochaetaceae bacterium]
MQKFADEALIEVSSGSGGNGCAAFHREKFVPKGGPSGGDGGRGGDLIFEVRENLRTLSHLRYKQKFKAENGHDGEGRARYGKNGEDLVVPVPPGTILKDADSGELLRDFGKNPERWVFLKGGNGGWGNIHFKSSVNQSPKKALPGKPGEARHLRVELQLLADIGLVGFPNAGKSSLLDRFTRARPKIAPYPFTTKIPNLGVLTYGARASDKNDDFDAKNILIADIPGLIEGASTGAGLGIRFLKHISRTRALVFLIDLSKNNYLTAFSVLLNELASFSSDLAEKKRIIVGSKMDFGDSISPSSAERLEELKKALPEEKIFGISVFSGEGLDILAEEIVKLTTDNADERG